ncbi:MAG TPA: DUF4279 domain-containing protein [Candidatus Saccharimonadales bacterium]|nr:DUF4279 domain-containing protein [Candidatus Saccharimonadales bacterium]
MSSTIRRKPEPLPEDKPVLLTFSAALRIFGDNLDHAELTRTLGLDPTHSHRKGEIPSPGSSPWPNDMWSYDAPVLRTLPLQEQISALEQVIRPQIPYLRSLRPKFHVDVFCSCQGKIYPASLKVDHRALALFTELETPFTVSFLLAR